MNRIPVPKLNGDVPLDRSYIFISPEFPYLYKTRFSQVLLNWLPKKVIKLPVIDIFQKLK